MFYETPVTIYQILAILMVATTLLATGGWIYDQIKDTLEEKYNVKDAGTEDKFFGFSFAFMCVSPLVINFLWGYMGGLSLIFLALLILLSIIFFRSS